MRALVTALLLITVAGCGQGRGPTGSGGEPLPDDRTFLSTKVTGHDLVANTRLWLRVKNGRFEANAGCNSLLGQARLADDRLVLSDLGSTEMGCEEKLMDQDDWLRRFLSNRPRWQLSGDTLTLTGDGVTIYLVDEQVAQPDRKFAKTRWQLDTIVEGQAASSVPSGVTAWLKFGEDGKVTGNTGCNELGGDYRVQRDQVTFGEIVMTKRACAEDVMSVERAMTTVLRGKIDYQIAGNMLTLTHESGTALRFRPA